MGIILPPGGQLVDKSDSLKKFEAYLRRRFPDRRTPIDYLSDVRQFMAVCQKEWREVNMHDIDAFVDQQRANHLKVATVNRRVAALKTFFDFLAEENDDLSWANPVRYKRHAGKRPRSLPRDISDNDVEKVWNVIASKRDRAWFALMVRGGLRVGEVVLLKVKDVVRQPSEGHPAQVRVQGKGQKERMVLLSADAYSVLQQWLDERGERPEANVFFNQHGQPLSANGIEWLLHGYGEQVGLKLSPHQLRHTFARQLTEAGMPITSVGKLLGHSQITTTQIYTSGADPGLAQAYQTAMTRVVGEATPPEKQPEVPSAPLSRAPRAAEPEPEMPDLQAWAPHLPALIRSACSEYVKHCFPSWPVRRRKIRTQKLLCELRQLWDWFLAYRPIQHPGEISYRDLLAYQSAHQEKGHAAGTINRRLDYIIAIGRRLADQEQRVDNSIFRLRDLPRPQSLPRHLSDTEGLQLEALLRSRMGTTLSKERLENACMWIMLHSGLRVGECADLHYQDLDLPSKRLVIRLGKGQRDRVVYLSDVTCQAILTYLNDVDLHPIDLFFLQPSGKPVTVEWLRVHVAAIGKAVGIDNLYPHRLRHTCATRLLNAGMEITRIQKLLGHENLATTMIYARVQDATVETDYRQAMQLIERKQMPFSTEPVEVKDWLPQNVKVQNPIDNSV
jgi:site-specific recombinase XerD